VQGRLDPEVEVGLLSAKEVGASHVGQGCPMRTVVGSEEAPALERALQQ
jgi:hypothetical protein